MSARPTEAIETLKAMRELLSVPERWTKHRDARNGDGESVSSISTSAVCWCLAGAGIRTSADAYVMTSVFEAISAQCGTVAIGSWNDAPERTHAEVLALLDRAIAQAEGT